MARYTRPESRLTLDVDGADRWDSLFKMLSCYFNIHNLYGVWPRIDKSRHGFHLVAFVEDEQADMLEMRRVLGDDHNRIWWSEKARDFDQVLFTVKRGYRVTKDIKVI